HPLRVVHEQAGERVHLDPVLSPEGLADDGHPFLDREERVLLRVDEDRDRDLVEDRETAADDVEVTVRDGIERAGKHGPRVFAMTLTIAGGHSPAASGRS